MASSSRTTAFVALLLAFNLVLLPLTANAACYVPKKPKPTPKPFIPRPAKCPIDTLKLGVCANVLNLVNVVVGTPPKTPCCALLQGLVDAEVALCLCTAIKANVLGINLNIPLSLSLLVNYCGKSMPSGFECS